MEVIGVLGVSIVLQFAAACLALRLIPVTGGRRAWLLISAAICLMAVRRCMVLIEQLSFGSVPEESSTLLTEWVSLGTSGLMLAGIAWIAPLFTSIKRTADELRVSEEKYRTLFEDSRDAIFVSSREGRFIDVNPAMLELYGYTREEMIGMDVRTIYVDPAERAQLQSAIEKEGLIKDFEVKFRKKDGTEIDCMITATVQRDQSGAIHAYRGINRDCTELKSTLKMLEKERKKFYSLLKDLPGLVSLRAQDYAVPFANRTFQDHFGDPAGRKCYDFMKSCEKPCSECPIVRVFETGKKQSMEYVLPDNRTYQLYHYPYLDDDGSMLVLELAIDITERKQAEECLRQSEAKFRAVAEAIPVVILICRGDQNLYANPASEAISGYRREEMVKMSYWDVVHPDYRKRLTAGVAALERGEPVSDYFETKIITKSGDERWIGGRNTSMEYDGQPARLLTAVDLTERVELEQQLRQAQKMEAIARLAGGIAHEFNNLLAIILGYSGYLFEQFQDHAFLRAPIEEIETAAKRGAALVSQLLAFSGRQVIQRKVLNINAVVTDLEKPLQRLMGEDIAVVTMLEPELEPVKADPAQIQQIILNLAVNARDAMPTGGQFTIETANADLAEANSGKHCRVRPGRYVMIAVSDSGVGMDESALSRIFDPFFTTKGIGKGTGLGLASVHGIIEQNKGCICVDSEPNKGTTFKIYFPQFTGELQSSAAPSVPAASTPGAETVLLVEADQKLRTIAAASLREHGYTVLAASRGEEALRLLEQHRGPLHLTVTDVVMPGMSGRELADRLSPLRPEMKVLFLSGYTENINLHHGTPDQDIAFLPKPFTPDTLLSKVREVLNGSLS